MGFYNVCHHRDQISASIRTVNIGLGKSYFSLMGGPESRDAENVGRG